MGKRTGKNLPKDFEVIRLTIHRQEIGTTATLRFKSLGVALLVALLLSWYPFHELKLIVEENHV